MIVKEKEQYLEQVFDIVACTVDSQGRPIDLGIMGTVLYLNVHGIRTISSCEGHLDRGLAYPWVRVPTEDHGKLVEVLTAFNREHEEDGEQAMDRTLVVVSALMADMCILQNFGAACQNEREPQRRAQKLAEYQREMQSFAEWLRDRFFEGE
jgi:hypothetical protein